MYADCPHCNASHYVGNKIAGDKIWCTCDCILLVVFQGGRAYLYIV